MCESMSVCRVTASAARARNLPLLGSWGAGCNPWPRHPLGKDPPVLYDTVAKAGVAGCAAPHIAALRGIAPPQVDLLRIARARSLAPTTRPVIRASEAGTSVTSTIRTRFKQRLLLYVSRTRSFAALLPPWHPYCTVLTVHRVGKRPPNPSKITPFSGDSGLVFHSALRSASPPPGWRTLSA